MWKRRKPDTCSYTLCQSDMEKMDEQGKKESNKKNK